ncbi:MAG: gamma carbonic anhydrase family protein [Thermoplasmataceae archaeon]
MAVYEFEERVPELSKSCFVFGNATVIGKVTIGENVWVGPGAVIRGDYGEIIIGDGTAVEDNCVIHARPGEKTIIGKNVTLGHSCVIHTAEIEDNATIGMKSVVTDFAKVGKWAVIAEGSVVKKGQVIPDEAIAAGVPAKEIGKVKDEFKVQWTVYKKNYQSFCSRYKENLHEKK